MSMPALDKPVFQVLQERGFIKQTTDADAVRTLINGPPITFYHGVDPTADCLHIGHLLPVMMMRWLQAAGHQPIMVFGGATAMLGDPTGKTALREFLTPEEIAHNVHGQKQIYRRFLDLDHAVVTNNADWLSPLNYITFLRDVGRHFSINRMLGATGAQQRLDRNQGYSFTEFNYHLLQSYDFLHLHKTHGCILQMGGDDQWFNMLGGVDLIRRECGATAHAMTVPLMMTADGKKMGKTEAGAVWIASHRLSSYDYYQYWVNVDDRDVSKLLKLYTALPMEQIAEYDALTGADIRIAKRALAHAATALAHGDTEADRVAKAAHDAFSGNTSEDMPTATVALPAPLYQVMKDAGLVDSNGAARRMIQGGGARIDGEKVDDPNRIVNQACVVWAGKKKRVRVLPS